MARRKLFFAIVVLAAITGAGVTFISGWSAEREPPAASAAMKVFDQDVPGRGLDSHSNKVEDHAMAYALYASASAIMGRKDDAVMAADWLVENPASPGATGWGLPFAWDAFGDESENPKNTIYGVTTALAVRALLDVYELTDEASYLDTAKNALDYYSNFFEETESGGYFWYSDQKEDNVDVHNISAILMGQYARASQYFPEGPYAELARKAHANLVAKKRLYGGKPYWTYSTETDRANDLVHAAYIAQGFIDYTKHLDSEQSCEDEVDYLLNFFSNDSLREFPTHVDDERPARVWGVGMLIYTLADVGRVDAARRAALILHDYEASPNVFAARPGREEFFPRMQSHVVFGLARFEQKQAQVQ